MVPNIIFIVCGAAKAGVLGFGFVAPTNFLE
jgi:hypothetical protein